jgi:hypothetical protein
MSFGAGRKPKKVTGFHRVEIEKNAPTLSKNRKRAKVGTVFA